MAAQTDKNDGPIITPALVLAQIEREHEIRQLKDSTKDVNISVIRKFFELNNKSLGAELSVQFFKDLERRLSWDECNEDSAIKLASNDSAYKSRVRAVPRAQKALTGSLFRQLLSDYLAQSALSKDDIAKAAKLSTGTLNFLKNRDTLAGVDAGKIRLLDEVLNANGDLVCSYASIAVILSPKHLLTSAAQGSSFAAFLRAQRTQTGLSRMDIERKTGISEHRLRSWEAGLGVPPLPFEKEISALDQLLNCNGQLLESWKSADPRQHCVQLQPYRLRKNDWPSRALQQWEAFVDFNTMNSKELPKENPVHWRQASVDKVQETIERFFGFLINYKNRGGPHPLDRKTQKLS